MRRYRWAKERANLCARSRSKGESQSHNKDESQTKELRGAGVDGGCVLSLSAEADIYLRPPEPLPEVEELLRGVHLHPRQAHVKDESPTKEMTRRLRMRARPKR